ncbi:MAG: MBL fold metallo-hydrolase [Planctomycetes bacterium]|nr:MBL fold metallo-hydrolase [Planctomycetota bacterium]
MGIAGVHHQSGLPFVPQIEDIPQFALGQIESVGYVVWCDGTGEAVIVDPGAATDQMLSAVAEWASPVAAVLLTHAHLDHVEGLGLVRDYTDAPIYLHAEDRPLLDALPAQAAMFGLTVPEVPPPDEELSDGDHFRFGESTFEVVHTPGHSPGHVILRAVEDGFVLVGDLVFAGSIGRTDLPGGDYRALFESIRKHVLTLPDDTRLYSGHGPETTVGHERIGNPFLIHMEGERSEKAVAHRQRSGLTAFRGVVRSASPACASNHVSRSISG